MMRLGKILGKVLTAPIKTVAMPFRVLQDVAEDDGESLIKTVTDSIEKQTKDIFEG